MAAQCGIAGSTKIGKNCTIGSIITDKNVEISDDKVLTGSDTYPLYIGKDGKL